jgi:hypothetical protein
MLAEGCIAFAIVGRTAAGHDGGQEIVWRRSSLARVQRQALPERQPERPGDLVVPVDQNVKNADWWWQKSYANL